MKASGMVRMLTGFGLVVLGATVAHAGGGQGIAPSLTSFFVCHNINGSDQGQTVDVKTDELGFPDVDKNSVRVGSGVLACTQVRVYPEGDAVNEIVPGSLVPLVPNGPYLKCYTVSSPRKPGAPPAGTPTQFTATDYFEPTGETLQASALRYLCAPAQIETLP